jgi:predicted transcriptional regulator
MRVFGLSSRMNKAITSDAGQRSEKAAGLKAMQQMWGGAITEQSGFVAVPVSLLKAQDALGLSAVDMIVLINLLVHRWTATTGVYPRNTVIAKRMGVAPRTVQRSMQNLLEKGLMRRVRDEGGKRVLYFDPLLEKLARITPATIWRKEAFDDA